MNTKYNDVKSMPLSQVQRALGMVERFSGDTPPPTPPMLRRTYGATCLVCARRTSTVKKYERLAVCYPCKAALSKKALIVKDNGVRRRRHCAGLRVAWVMKSLGLEELRHLQRMIVNFLGPARLDLDQYRVDSP